MAGTIGRDFISLRRIAVPAKLPHISHELSLFLKHSHQLKFCPTYQINNSKARTASTYTIVTTMDLDSIELHLQRMRVAAETKQYATAESEYKLALTRAEELVEEEAPFLLMLLCMASLYKSQFKWAEAEYYSERARQIIEDER